MKEISKYFKDLHKGLKLLPEVVALLLDKKAKDLKAYSNNDYEKGYVQGCKDCSNKRSRGVSNA